MSGLGIVGIVLVVLGLGVLAYQEVAFATMLVPPILGALSAGSGLMLLIAGPRR